MFRGSEVVVDRSDTNEKYGYMKAALLRLSPIPGR